MIQNLLDNYFLQNPLRIAERTRLIMSFATALWNAQHDEPIDGSALHLFLCDETRGALTEDQKCFVRKCRAEVDRIYFRMLGKQEQESRAMFRPALPARSLRVRFFQKGKACTPVLKVWPLWAALGSFRGTKEKAG